MTLQSSVDVGIINNADGAQITGGDIARTLAWLGGNIAFTTAGDAVHTLPATNSVLLSNQPGEISALTAKNPPLGADILLIEDSAASFAKKKLSITNLLNSGLIATLGGWTIGETTISADDLTLDSDMPAIKMGAATDYLTGIGAFIGQSGSIYKFSLGDPNGKYIAFDGTGLASGGIWLSGKNLDLNNVPVLNDITWTDNSPTAGKVAWSEFHLTYMGLTYTVVAGNTDKKFLWWNKATSTTALQSSNTPPDLANDQFMVALNYAGTRQTALFSSFIYSDFIKVTNLAAISADMGTITAGTITGATIRTAASGTRLNLNTSELAAYLLTAKTVSLQMDGDLFIGADVSAANTTSVAVFTNAQTYNSESMGAGDVLLGNNSSGYANILWDFSDKQLKFRGGTTTKTYIDTDGSIKFGGGAGALNTDGITLTVDPVTATWANTLKWTYAYGTGLSIAVHHVEAGFNAVFANIDVKGNATDTAGSLVLSAGDSTGNYGASISLYGPPGGPGSLSLNATNGNVSVTGNSTTINGPLEVTGAATIDGSVSLGGIVTFTGTNGNHYFSASNPVILNAASGSYFVFRTNGTTGNKMYIDTSGNMMVLNGFGCNGKTPQQDYASGGALAAYATGTYGLDTAAHMSSLHAMVVKIRAALVANGIMS